MWFGSDWRRDIIKFTFDGKAYAVYIEGVACFPQAYAAVNLVEQQAQQFVNDLFSTLRERMLDLRFMKVIFVGGGAILLRKQIEASGKVGIPLFVEDINANAILHYVHGSETPDISIRQSLDRMAVEKIILDIRCLHSAVITNKKTRHEK